MSPHGSFPSLLCRDLRRGGGAAGWQITTPSFSTLLSLGLKVPKDLVPSSPLHRANRGRGGQASSFSKQKTEKESHFVPTLLNEFPQLPNHKVRGRDAEDDSGPLSVSSALEQGRGSPAFGEKLPHAECGTNLGFFRYRT